LLLSRLECERLTEQTNNFFVRALVIKISEAAGDPYDFTILLFLFLLLI
jgi:hypothetical protein